MPLTTICLTDLCWDDLTKASRELRRRKKDQPFGNIENIMTAVSLFMPILIPTF